MELKVQILGSSSAIPLSGRNPTAQFVTIASRHFLVDCGEGTQIQLRRNRIGFSRIEHILISHLHGDHFYGLVPLLSTLHLLDRQKEVHIYGPPELEKGIYDLLALSHAKLRYPLVFHPLNMKEPDLVYEDKGIKVHSFPLKHSLPCCGFFFQEKPKPRKFIKEALAKYSIPNAEIRQIKQGADWEDENGNIVPNHELTTDAPASLSYAFCTDTKPIKQLRKLLPDAPDLLYHEATFSEDLKDRAKQTKHSTAKQAAEIAQLVEAKHLIIGHFSVRYDEFDELLQEAKAVFPKTHIAVEKTTFKLQSSEKLLIELGS
ncbi:ribonuclease Z [Owenweeksia hongkongensis DSM 17368]|uniref:Ribonuclease Z n=1 Tax=Owenweeksia hongkongensis (strain DSM 17368 / CIP 108786 / JCM 12287 / NRRL B-23963 / UST20020801) TaxID=926562 RepID=G8QZ55_OWEHD|nr:ribonuclease Z [Owenweeksia hongkongensis]AEV31438.1 ribonuclease Z [Owenweeksia hongkongensis DSM 17368]